MRRGTTKKRTPNKVLFLHQKEAQNMNISKISIFNTHRTWSNNIMNEQRQSVKIGRKLLKKSRTINPFANNKQTDAILARYEKSFWGSGICWNDIPKLI